MKKIKSGIIAFIVLVLMSGCVKSNTNLIINKDKSMNLNMDLLISDKILQSMNMSIEDLLNSEELKNTKNSDVEVKAKKENGYSGVNISSKFDNIDNLSTDSEVNANLTSLVSDEELENLKMFKVTKGFLKNIYKAKLNFDLTESNEDEIETNTPVSTNEDTATLPNASTPSTRGMDTVLDSVGGAEELTNMVNQMEMNFAVKLPSKNISTNATNVSEDGKNLTWEISTMNGSVTTMEFEFSIMNTNNLYLLIGGCALLLVILIITIIVIKKNKNKKTDEIPTDGPIHKEFDASINTEGLTQVNNVITEPTIVEPQVMAEPVAEVAPVAPMTEPVVETPVMQPTIEPQVMSETVVEAAPVTPMMEPVVETPVMQPTIEPQVMSETVVEAAPVAPMMEPVVETPVMQPTIEPQVMAEPVVEAAPVTPMMEPVVETPVMQPTIEPQVMAEPVVEAAPAAPMMEPVVEVPAVAEVTMPTPAENLEFTLPEETASVDAQVIQTPETKAPMFVTPQPEEIVEEVPQVQELIIEKPDAIDIVDTQL